MMEDIFITGTDTDVGKTVLSALLVAALDGVYWKPIQTGASQGTDTNTVMGWAEIPRERTLPEAYRYDLPVSPHLAAEAVGETIDLAKVVRPPTTQQGPLIAEGAGGVLVPINWTQRVSDMILQLGLPVLVASRTAIGTINHTSLTVYVLQNIGVKVKGVVMIGRENRDNERSIERFVNVPILGRIPFLEKINRTSLLHAFNTHFDKQAFR
jgi:dethiobiotin synthetase